MYFIDIDSECRATNSGTKPLSMKDRMAAAADEAARRNADKPLTAPAKKSHEHEI